VIKPQDFFNLLREKGISFYTGVPDSLLKEFCSFVNDNVPAKNHIITANEGAAVSLASGYYLATGNPALVYMQNSGLGNSVNPLLSLADKEVYSIPVLLLVGWRGEPGKKDEPQHIKQGKVMLKMLESMEIEHAVLGETIEQAGEVVDEALRIMKEKNSPYVIAVREGTFEKYSADETSGSEYELSREEAIEIVLQSLGVNDIVVSTTGKASREVFEYRKRNSQGHEKDFLTVGSMGHSSQIALGIALSKPDARVINLDGDGSVIMHMGSLAVIGTTAPQNLYHIVLNNGAHESVGGQPTAGFMIDLPKVASACGYKLSIRANNSLELFSAINILAEAEGPVFLEIRVNKNSRKDLGRPDTSPKENKKSFMKFLGNETD
jgi:phosphonopyruvate decarboxylase